MSNLDLKRYWERFFSDRARRYKEKEKMAYASPFVTRHAFKKRYRVVEDFLAKNPFRDGRILDAGCGPGLFLGLLSGKGQPIGMDISAEMLGHIRGRMDIPLIRGDVTYPSFRDGIFDAVICIEVFQYLEDLEALRALEAFSRVLKDGGLILITTLNSEFLARFLKSSEYEMARDLGEMKKLLGEWFKVLDSGYIAVFPDWIRPVEMLAERLPRGMMKYLSVAIFLVAKVKRASISREGPGITGEL